MRALAAVLLLTGSAFAQTTAFVDVAVVPMDREQILPHHTVVVKDGRISAIGPSGKLAAPPGAKVIDGRGRWLIPGLADMHQHLRSVDDLKLHVAKGVTLVRNMWGAPLHLEWRARIAKGELLGPTLYTAGPILDGDPPVHDGSWLVLAPEEAEAAIAMHKKLGYDFAKVLVKLAPPVWERLVRAAHAAKLDIAGHVPRGVPLAKVVAEKQTCVEHLNGFLDQLQREGSAVRDKWDRQSRLDKPSQVDESKLPELVESIRAAGVWSCPTRAVFRAWASAAEVKPMLARPEMKYVPPCERTIWEPGPDDAAEIDADRRAVQLFDRVIAALARAGAPLAAGTDTGNPLVIPGFALHEELQLYVRAGLKPYQALRAATIDAARLAHMESERGTIAAGKRADLVLLDGDPLADISATSRIRGVMLAGRWHDAAAITKLLDEVAAEFENTAPFRKRAPLPLQGTRELSAAYEIQFRGAHCGGERLAVDRAADGTRVISAENFDPHRGQWVTARLWRDAAGEVQRVVIESDGTEGRGGVEARRQGARLLITGRSLAGQEIKADESLAATASLGVHQLFASQFAVAARAAKLSPGASLDFDETTIGLGSRAKLRSTRYLVSRQPDATVELSGKKLSVRRLELKPQKGPPTLIDIDQDGRPFGLSMPSFGLVIRRVE